MGHLRSTALASFVLVLDMIVQGSSSDLLFPSTVGTLRPPFRACISEIVQVGLVSEYDCAAEGNIRAPVLVMQALSFRYFAPVFFPVLPVTSGSLSFLPLIRDLVICFFPIAESMILLSKAPVAH